MFCLSTSLCCGFLLVFSLLMVSASPQDIINELDKPIPIESVSGVLGKKAILPCDISTKDPNDAVSMVLWFNASDGEPFYSFDVRSSKFSDAKIWASPTHFQGRVNFHYALTPAQLVISDLRAEDQGIYKCRVDYRNSPTRNQKVNLTIIIPPRKPIVYDATRKDTAKSVVAFNEGADVVLICEVTGGSPKPKVTWYLDNRVLDVDFEYVPGIEPITINRLTHKFSRQDLNAKLVCQASNNILEPPAFNVLTVDLNLKPTAVHILTKEKGLSADRKYDVECRAYGSRPEAVITWWKGNKQIKRLAKNYSEEGGQTLSILSIVPSVEDNGRYLTCRAENPYITDSALEDKWRLNVFYPPDIKMGLGPNINPDDIKEGDDVYFECTVDSNPKAYKLAWYHNGKELHHNITAGVILSDTSLVLQKVKRTAAGEYVCKAANNEGKGSSPPALLKVMYVPICRDEREELYGALKHETVALRCEVDANPPEVSFHWTFNNSGDLNEVPVARYSSTDTISKLNYTPVSDMDYGTLACWGTNAVGQQKVPCVFQVVAAGHPFPLTNCTILNQTSDSLHVECMENFDGGLPQTFLMELLELPGLYLRRNLTVTKAPPMFDIYGLEPGTTYQVNLFAVNAKGRSEPFVIETVTFKGVAKYTGVTAALPMSPVLTGLIATATALVFVVCLVLAALYKRNQAKRPISKHAVVLVSDVTEDGRPPNLSLPLNPVTPANGDHRITTDDTDPDVIPNKHERRPLKGFMKIYKTPPQRRKKKKTEEEDEEEVDDETKALNINHRYSTKDKRSSQNHQVNNINGSHSNSLKVNRGVTASSPIGSCGDMAVTAHGHRHEIVTTSHRLQESCI